MYNCVDDMCLSHIEVFIVLVGCIHIWPTKALFLCEVLLSASCMKPETTTRYIESLNAGCHGNSVWDDVTLHLDNIKSLFVI